MRKKDPIIIRCNTISFLEVDPEKIRKSLQKIKDNNFQKVIDKLYWEFNSQFCDYAQPQKLFLVCSKITIYSLKIIYCKSAKILNSMAHINFERLKNLELEGNNILSIEQLYLFRMPVLENLLLQGNKINNLRGLQRANLPNLKMLKISMVSVITLDSLFMYSHLPALHNIFFDKCIGCQNLLKIENIYQKENVIIKLRRSFLTNSLKKPSNKIRISY